MLPNYRSEPSDEGDPSRGHDALRGTGGLAADGHSAVSATGPGNTRTKRSQVAYSMGSRVPGLVARPGVAREPDCVSGVRRANGVGLPPRRSSTAVGTREAESGTAIIARRASRKCWREDVEPDGSIAETLRSWTIRSP